VANVPTTSITLLSALSNSVDSVRWTEFFRVYEPAMRGFLHDRFPSVEPEDAMQETLVALTRALPDYRYTPDEKGHFRNYLMGILRHKAADLLKKSTRQSELCSRVRNEQVAFGRNVAPPQPSEENDEEILWQQHLLEAAIDQLLADERITPTTREIFRHVALLHETPDAVAAQFGVTRNNVDQIKKRLIGKLTELVRTMSTEG